jgi:hypothetical protein
MRTVYLIFFIIYSNSIMATDEPDFKTILKDGKIEIREYAPKIIAQVEVFGDFDEASSKGFKVLADYIFGNNTSTDGNSRIEMTAPVEMEPLSQKINMTKPVLTEGNDNTWIVSFIMPNEFTLETLPKPNNKDIKIARYNPPWTLPFFRRNELMIKVN